jgi:hypothetical protein
MKRRDVLLLLTSVFLGPLIASIVFTIVAAVAGGLVFGPRDAMVLIQLTPLVVMAGYLFGAIPALIGSIVVAISSRRLTAYKSRLLLGASVGLLASVPLVALFLAGSQHVSIAMSLVPAGATAGLACTAFAEWLDT